MSINIWHIITICALAIVIIFDLIESSKRRERKKKLLQEKEEWGRLMYTKGYKDGKAGKSCNPPQTMEDL